MRILLNEKFILGIIILNTLCLFIGGFFPTSKIFPIIDGIFSAIFILEALLKIRSLSWKRYWANGWNKFDLVITILAIPTFLSLFLQMNWNLNVLLSLRVLRVFKTIRLFKYIPNIASILNGIRQAIKASTVVVLGVSVLLLVISLLTSAIFGNILPDYFGDPGNALYSTFKMFTVEGWYEIPDMIAEKSSIAMATFAKVYFAIILFVGGILGMSLINSIFVDAALSDNNDEVMKELSEIKDLLKKQK